jgi:hypothetical protein
MAEWPLVKVISGGQTGADQGGLEAGRYLGYATGGMAPKGYRTELGSQVTHLKRYGLTESHFATYPPRTRQNIRNSDGTVIFGNCKESGTRLTIDICYELGKPFLVNCTAEVIRAWVIAQNICVLNVAGNRASKDPALFLRVYDTLLEGLRRG